MTVREAFSIAADEVQTCSTLARDPGSAQSSLVPRSEAEAQRKALWDAKEAELDEYRAANATFKHAEREWRYHAEALAEALEAITRDDCMISNGETGSWIDTEAPSRIAEAALESYRARHPKETP
jgi:hypothetical protein